jgi:hypothetical protein
MPRARAALAVALACLSALACGASGRNGWTVDTLPNPVSEPARCGRSDVDRSFVCDPDGLLSRAGATALEAQLAAIHRAAPPTSGGKSGADGSYPRATCGTAGTPTGRGYEARVARCVRRCVWFARVRVARRLTAPVRCVCAAFVLTGCGRCR